MGREPDRKEARERRPAPGRAEEPGPATEADAGAPSAAAPRPEAAPDGTAAAAADGGSPAPPREPVDAADGAAPAAEDHGLEVEHDLDELVARARKADEYLALAQRTQADFENYRKRMAREVAAAEGRAIGRLARELLPALDNLERALEAAGGGEAPPLGEEAAGDHLAAGVKLVHADLLAALARVGIEPFSPQGERFDPAQHEAMAQQPVEGAEPGTVAEVYQRGYRLHGSVLRPARVVVAA